MGSTRCSIIATRTVATRQGSQWSCTQRTGKYTGTATCPFDHTHTEYYRIQQHCRISLLYQLCQWCGNAPCDMGSMPTRRTWRIQRQIQKGRNCHRTDVTITQMGGTVLGYSLSRVSRSSRAKLAIKRFSPSALSANRTTTSTSSSTTLASRMIPSPKR